MSVAAAAQKIRRSKIHQTDGYFHYEPNFTIEVIEILQMLSTNTNTISYIMKIFWKTGDHIHLWQNMVECIIMESEFNAKVWLIEFSEWYLNKNPTI